MTTPIVEMELENAVILHMDGAVKSVGEECATAFSCLQVCERIRSVQGGSERNLKRLKGEVEIAIALNRATTR